MAVSILGRSEENLLLKYDVFFLTAKLFKQGRRKSGAEVKELKTIT